MLGLGRVPSMGGTCLGVLLVRTFVSWGLGPPICGSYRALQPSMRNY